MSGKVGQMVQTVVVFGWILHGLLKMNEGRGRAVRWWSGWHSFPPSRKVQGSVPSSVLPESACVGSHRLSPKKHAHYCRFSDCNSPVMRRCECAVCLCDRRATCPGFTPPLPWVGRSLQGSSVCKQRMDVRKNVLNRFWLHSRTDLVTLQAICQRK